MDISWKIYIVYVNVWNYIWFSFCWFVGGRTPQWSANIRGMTLNVYRGYYTVARRYEFYFRVAKQYFMNERSEWVKKYCFCPEKIKFISSSRHLMFFLLCRQNDIDKIMEGNYRNYVIDKLTCEIMENKPLGSRV